MKKSEITGIVLSGGKSSRLGTEKGLARYGGKPLVAYSIDALKPLCGEILLSANNELENYSRFGLRIVQDEIEGVGPMGGLLACLKQSQTRFNLVLSCDIPFVESELLSYLLSQIENEQVLVPVNGNGLIEPLCGYYNTNVISQLEESVHSGNYKLLDFFKKINLKKVLIDRKLPFFNEQL
ncbi:MAG TPA: molybdenum cofactor guanylyltransferase, partial [Bacteroidales bacterium]